MKLQWCGGGLWPAVVVLFLAATLSPLSPAQAAVERFKFQSAGNYLIVEFLNDNTAHFEVSALGPGPEISVPLATTPQVFKTDYAGPSSPVNQSGAGTLETPTVKVAVDANLCVTVTDKTKGLELTTICPLNLGPTNLAQGSKGLTVAPGPMQHVYGLGEQFLPGTTNSDWTGRVRSPGDDFGNQMTGFDGGSNGNAQIPVMYAVGPNNANYVLFLDEPYKQTWNFTGNPWKVEMGPYPKGGDEVVIDQVRWYVIAGSDLPALREAYMNLTGHPPVPPKKMFGLWVSQYGFNNWAEVDGKRNNLRDDKFPIDGFVLDLQWFGGVPASGTIPSRMGSLNWDISKFPDPKAAIANYKKNDGIGIIAIEESYIDKGLPEHQDLTNRSFLVRQCKNGPNSTCNPALDCPSVACPPVFLSSNPWWGTGGMIDWTNAAAADYWHDTKRQPNLIDSGVIGHWIDLGEPEQYNFVDWTVGVVPGRHGHADYHNLYNFKWAESIARGYARHNVAQRPFMMARSGAAGIQRFGVAMWSGDIGSDLASLATDENAQMHMSFSGIDYFGSDIGGFHRNVSGDDLNDLYTQWFADAMMFDVPGRPHTEDLCNCRETAPDKVGNVASNLANLRQRYELSPYLYSLAHRAYLAGEPFAPPLVYYYQNDMNVRRIGDEKLLGRDILAAVVSSPGAIQRDVYLPAGDWINYHTNEWVHSTGQSLAAQPVYRDGIFRLPTFVRAGAILPKMFIDDKSMNIAGKRTDGSTHSELIVRAYASPVSSSFTLYEDDGETVAYQSGAVRTTPIFQQRSSGNAATVTIGAASGSYDGAPDSRDNVVELVAQDMQGKDVTLNGTHLPEQKNRADFDAATKGWLNAGGNVILAKSGKMNVADAKRFEFTLSASFVLPSEKFICTHGDTTWGQSVYVVGNVERLGNWNPAAAIKLDPNGPYPIWAGTIDKLPPATPVEWKCIKRPENAAFPVVWQPGSNNAFTSAASGSGGTTTGDFAGRTPGGASAQFVCDNGTTQLGQSVYAVGDAPSLGLRDPAKALKLDPTAYPRWTGTVANLPPATTIKWKCIKRPENAASPVVSQPSSDSQFTTFTTGDSATIGELIVNKIKAPAIVDPLRRRDLGAKAKRALAALALSSRRAFFPGRAGKGACGSR